MVQTSSASALPASDDVAKPNRLFAYGTLVEPRCLDEVLGYHHPGERLRARLRGYQRVATDRYPYPFIVAATGGVVDGVLLLDVGPNELRALDRYEDVDEGVYRRELVDVEAWGCGPRTLRVTAYAYVAGPALLPATVR